jgi:hypothetical protein
MARAPRRDRAASLAVLIAARLTAGSLMAGSLMQ